MKICEYTLIKFKGVRLESTLPDNLWRLYGYYLRVYLNTLNEVIYSDDSLIGWIVTINVNNFDFSWKSEFLIEKTEEFYE